MRLRFDEQPRDASWLQLEVDGKGTPWVECDTAEGWAEDHLGVVHYGTIQLFLARFEEVGGGYARIVRTPINDVADLIAWRLDAATR